jgi:hypothetical protein
MTLDYYPLSYTGTCDGMAIDYYPLSYTGTCDEMALLLLSNGIPRATPWRGPTKCLFLTNDTPVYIDRSLQEDISF